MEINLTIVS